MMASSDKRIALVTGANKGIGMETVRQLAETGATVFLGARDEQRGRTTADALAARGLNVTFVRLDLHDVAGIADAALTIKSAYGRLDILVNNAGIVDPGDAVPSSASIDSVRRIFDTNFFGTLMVTQAMLPLLRKSDSGRIVNMSSACGSLDMNGDPSSPFYAAQFIGYNASKAAVNMLTVQLAQELRDTAISVTAVCPGFVDTDLSSNRGHVRPADAARVPVRVALLSDKQASGSFVDAEGELPW